MLLLQISPTPDYFFSLKKEYICISPLPSAHPQGGCLHGKVQAAPGGPREAGFSPRGSFVQAELLSAPAGLSGDPGAAGVDRSPSLPSSPGAVRAIIIILVVLQCLPRAGNQAGEHHSCRRETGKTLGCFWLVHESCWVLGKVKQQSCISLLRALLQLCAWAQWISF